MDLDRAVDANSEPAVGAVRAGVGSSCDALTAARRWAMLLWRGTPTFGVTGRIEVV
jgi:hypothetical protein